MLKIRIRIPFLKRWIRIFFWTNIGLSLPNQYSYSIIWFGVSYSGKHQKAYIKDNKMLIFFVATNVWFYSKYDEFLLYLICIDQRLWLQVSIAGLQAEYKQIAETIGEAKNILIVGGGPVGVELAGKTEAIGEAKNILIVGGGPVGVELGGKTKYLYSCYEAVYREFVYSYKIISSHITSVPDPDSEVFWIRIQGLKKDLTC